MFGLAFYSCETRSNRSESVETEKNNDAAEDMSDSDFGSADSENSADTTSTSDTTNTGNAPSTTDGAGTNSQ